MPFRRTGQILLPARPNRNPLNSGLRIWTLGVPQGSARGMEGLVGRFGSPDLANVVSGDFTPRSNSYRWYRTAFDGSTKYGFWSDTTGIDRTAAQTQAGWFRTSGGSNNRVWSWGQTGSTFGLFAIIRTTTGRFAIGTSAGFLETTTAFNDNNWHYFVQTYDGGSTFASLKLYLDGVAVATTEVGTFAGAGNTSEFLTLAAERDDSVTASYLACSLDDFRFYDRVLTQQEALDLYLASLDDNVSLLLSRRAWYQPKLSGGASVAVGLAIETDTAQPVTPVAGAVSVAVGLATETDTAQPVTPVSGAIVAVGLATETDTAQPVTVSAGAVSVSVGLATETDTAQPVTPFIGGLVLVGLASETDTAQPVTPVAGAVSVAVGVATETDTAQPVTPVSVVSISVGLASETDIAQTITAVGGPVSVVVGLATEIDTALPVSTGAGFVVIGVASEADAALPVTATAGPVTVSVGLATEADVALSVTPLAPEPIVTAVEAEPFDFLQWGSEWLTEQRQAHLAAAIEIEYLHRSGKDKLSISAATLAGTRQFVQDAGIAFEMRYRDFIIKRKELLIDVPTKAFVLPQIGDVVRWTRPDGVVVTFQVQQENSATPYWRWHDPYHEEIVLTAELTEGLPADDIETSGIYYTDATGTLLTQDGKLVTA